MKPFLFPVLFFTASIALAGSPKVGDMAAYQMSTAFDNLSFRQEISAYEAQKNSYTVESEVVDGEKLTKNSYSVDGDLLNDLYVQTSTQEYCDQKGGSVETITVPAGSFETCRVSVGGQVAWYSDLVPFGQVQVVTLDDNGKETSKQVLTGFSLGK